MWTSDGRRWSFGPLTLALALGGCSADDLPDARRGAARDPSEHYGARRVWNIVGLYGPESVRYDPDQDVFFVSNIFGYGSYKDGNGYIVRASAENPSQVGMFAQSGQNGITLHAPKGMAIHGDTLWVADIDVLRGFDRRTGAPLATIDLSAQNAVLLNDVDVGPDGSIYVTDTGIIMSEKGVLYPGGSKIFVIGPGRAVSVVAGSPDWPNGITWDAKAGRWLVVNFDPFTSQLVALRPGDSTRTLLATGKGRFDGVEALDDGRILYSAWNDSSLHLLTPQNDRRIIRHLVQPADIGLDTRRHRVAIPLVLPGRVEIWELPRE